MIQYEKGFYNIHKANKLYNLLKLLYTFSIIKSDGYDDVSMYLTQESDLSPHQEMVW